MVRLDCSSTPQSEDTHMCANNQRVLASDVAAIERGALSFIESRFPGAKIDCLDLDIGNPCTCALAQVSGEDYNTIVGKMNLTNEQALDLRVLAIGSKEQQAKRYNQLTNAWQVALYRNPQFVSPHALAA